MTKQLHYGIETGGVHSRLYLDVPVEVSARIQTHDGELTSTLQKLSTKRTRLLDIEPTDDGLRLYANTKKVGGIRGEYDTYRRQAAASITDALRRVGEWAQPEERDPRLDVGMGSRYSVDGRLPMYADIAWPEADEEAVEALAEKHMRETAKKLKYEVPLIEDLVFASVSRARGVTLQTNPVGSCSIDTDGMHYDQADPVFELRAHNIYAPQQQLICFAGTVAIANADALLSAPHTT